MSSTATLSDLAAALLSGSVRVVDLTAPLGPETPVMQLPPIFQEFAGGEGPLDLEL